MTIGVALVVAISGFFASKLVADRGYEGSIAVERLRQSAAADDESREKRATVYFEYLDAASNFSAETWEVSRSKTGTDERPNYTVPASWTEARIALQDATNDLSVYGSDRAWVAHRAVAAVVPSTLGSNLDSSDTAIMTRGPDSDAFLEAYRGFLDVVCEEIPAEPRADCSAD